MGVERSPFLFVGNHLALDFINTQMIVRGEVTDLLQRFEDLASWLVQAKLLTKPQSESVRTKLSRKDTASLLEQAKTLRATVRVLAERLATRKSIPDSAIDTINQFLSRCAGYPQVVRIQGGFARSFQTVAALEESVLAPLAESASDLLCLADFVLIKKCANDACILYFYDTTKNHRRNWCSMQLCGNRMKVAAYFQRKRKGAKR